MGTVILDTSVVIAAFDRDDAHHEAAASALHDLGEEGAKVVVSTVTVAEGLVRTPKSSARETAPIERFMASPDIHVHPVDVDIARLSADIRSKHKSFKLPDALIAATARMLDAPLLTADKTMARLERAIYLK